VNVPAVKIEPPGRAVFPLVRPHLQLVDGFGEQFAQQHGIGWLQRLTQPSERAEDVKLETPG